MCGRSIGTAFGISRSAVIDATGAIDAAAGNLSDCLHVDGTSGPCGSVSTTFIDAEIPAGTINGTNAAFTLANVPNPPASLALFRNGLLLTQGGDYTLSSNAITFADRRRAADQRHLGGVLSAGGEHSWRWVRRSADAHRRHQRRECRVHARARRPAPAPAWRFIGMACCCRLGWTTRSAERYHISVGLGTPIQRHLLCSYRIAQ